MIKLSNVDLFYPIYSDVSKSFKKIILDKVTGGNIIKSSDYYLVEALKNISINLYSGDRVGIIGSNGSGKTTLLRLLAGLLEPTSGSIHIDGSVNSFIDIHYGMNLEATGIENIRMRLILLGVKYRDVPAKVDLVSRFSELGKYLFMPVKVYSSGMLMRLSFSIMSSIDSDILLIDEWLSVGDEGFRVKADHKMRDMIKKSSIIIMASHEKQLINEFCNKVIHLEHGSLIN